MLALVRVPVEAWDLVGEVVGGLGSSVCRVTSGGAYDIIFSSITLQRERKPHINRLNSLRLLNEMCASIINNPSLTIEPKTSREY